MKKRRVDLFNCIPMIPVENAAFGNLPEPDHPFMTELKKQAGEYLPQMKHCQRCRADAAGMLGDKDPYAWQSLIQKAGNKSLIPDENRPYIAVATREGFLINQHLGEARSLSVYSGDNEGNINLEERRITPPRGGDDSRWETLADHFADCRAILVNGIGAKPKRILEKRGLKVYQVEGFLDDGVSKFFKGKSLASMSCRSESCGTACQGSGGGCG